MPRGEAREADEGDDARILLDTLHAAELEATWVGDARWMTMLQGEHKRTIPVLFHLGDRSLTVTSLLAGVPDEGHDDVYKILLRRNQRPMPVHFALDDEGDLILVGRIPLASMDATSVDELLGLLLTESDETFDQVLRAGFRSYIDVEQRWRAKVGLPPNPVDPGLR